MTTLMSPFRADDSGDKQGHQYDERRRYQQQLKQRRQQRRRGR
jgi:hypothetical protein